MMKKLFLTASLILTATAAQAQWRQSATWCHAFTDCLDPWGQVIGRISCGVYGWQHLQGLGVQAENSCRWFVQPYTAVQCAGYQASVDAWGNTVWAWQRFSQRCPGR